MTNLASTVILSRWEHRVSETTVIIVGKVDEPGDRPYWTYRVEDQKNLSLAYAYAYRQNAEKMADQLYCSSPEEALECGKAMYAYLSMCDRAVSRFWSAH